MNITAPSALLSKVQKLLNTSVDSGATEPERATALRLAGRLMDANRITEQDLAEARVASSPRGTRPEDLTQSILGKRRHRQDGWLGMAVAFVCGCEAYRTRYLNGKFAMAAIGLPADLAVAEALYTALQQTLSKGAVTYARERGVPANSIPANNWRDGFAIELLRRAKEERKAARTSTETVATQSTALVVIGEAVQQHEHALAVVSRKIGLCPGRRTRCRSDGAARAAGTAAARRVSLSRAGIR